LCNISSNIDCAECNRRRAAIATTKKELGLEVMVLYLTFNNISVISWQSVLFVEETGIPGENHRPVAGH
jgi:hypothetical protein